MFLFLMAVEPTNAIVAGHFIDPRSASVLVNHHDPEDAARIARVALVEGGWLVRTIHAVHVLPGEQLRELDRPVAALAERATTEGVAFSVDNDGDDDGPHPSAPAI